MMIFDLCRFFGQDQMLYSFLESLGYQVGAFTAFTPIRYISEGVYIYIAFYMQRYMVRFFLSTAVSITTTGHSFCSFYVHIRFNTTEPHAYMMQTLTCMPTAYNSSIFTYYCLFNAILKFIVHNLSFVL